MALNSYRRSSDFVYRNPAFSGYGTPSEYQDYQPPLNLQPMANRGTAENPMYNKGQAPAPSDAQKNSALTGAIKPGVQAGYNAIIGNPIFGGAESTLGVGGAALGAGLGGYGILSSDAPLQDKINAGIDLTQNSAANFYTAGLSGAAQKLGGAYAPGPTKEVNKLADTAEYLNPMLAGPKIAARAVSKLGIGGGKGGDQLARDSVRDTLRDPYFQGQGQDDWNLKNPDGSSFDIGKDDNYQLDANAPGAGEAITLVQPLSYLITGGDKKLAENFGGYLTNTIMQGGGGTYQGAAANAKDKYLRAGFDSPDKAILAIKDLIGQGKIPADQEAVMVRGINDAFGVGGAPAAAGGTGQSTGNSRTIQETRRPSSHGTKRRTPPKTYERQVYTPQVYAPDVTGPSQVGYGDDFAQALADVYRNNQEIGI